MRYFSLVFAVVALVVAVVALVVAVVSFMISVHVYRTSNADDEAREP